MAVIEITAEMTSAEQRAAQNTNNANLDNTKLDKSGGTVTGDLEVTGAFDVGSFTVTGDLEVTGAFDVGSFSDVANIKTQLGIGKQIWPTGGGKGNWSSGNITVPEINNYVMYFVTIDGAATVIPAFRYQSGSVVYFRGIGGYPSSSTQVITYQFAATVAGTTLTLVNCNNASHPSGEAHGTMGDRYVTAIYGLI